MWELDYKESWAPKCWCFWNVVLEKTLESLLDCKEIWLVKPKEISPEFSLGGLMLKLKLQYFGHLMRRTDSVEKTLMLGKIESRRRRGQQRMRCLDGITDSMGMSLSKFRELVLDSKAGVLKSMGSQRVRHNWETKLTDDVVIFPIPDWRIGIDILNNRKNPNNGSLTSGVETVIVEKAKKIH